MFRPSRPTLHWLLWLVVALLPLRGWAQVQMDNGSGWRTDHAAVAVSATLESPPCHVSAAHTPDATPGSTSDPDAASWTGSCAHCTVCHASLGLTWQMALDWPPLPHTAPTPQLATSVAERPPGKLFRPPRSPGA